MPADAQLRTCRSRAEGTAPIKMKVGRNDVRIGPLLLGNVRNAGAVAATDRADWPFVINAGLVPASGVVRPERAERTAAFHKPGRGDRSPLNRLRRVEAETLLPDDWGRSILRSRSLTERAHASR